MHLALPSRIAALIRPGRARVVALVPLARGAANDLAVPCAPGELVLASALYRLADVEGEPVAKLALIVRADDVRRAQLDEETIRGAERALAAALIAEVAA